jgi:hypothetical protein
MMSIIHNGFRDAYRPKHALTVSSWKCLAVGPSGLCRQSSLAKALKHDKDTVGYLNLLY